MIFNKTQLDNGIKVLSEHHSDSRCVVTGCWVEVGTRHESAAEVGISHLLEHMVFKGTEKYSALELAKCLEAKGGDINAFTAREQTCFHTTSLKEDLNLSIDVLAQVCAFAKFDPSDFEKEKRVVQQEILMSADDLEEYVFDLYYEKIFAGNPLGYQILGSTSSIASMTREQVVAYYHKHFVPKNLIITAAGSVDHDQLVKSVEHQFSQKQWGEQDYQSNLVTPEPQVVRDFFKKDCEQYHIIVGFPASSYSDENRFDGFILNTALGGGMTSRLYQSVREQRGLVYSIFSMLNTFTDTGIQTIYAGTDKDNVEEVVDLIKKELVEVRKNGLSQQDIEFYKTQAKGQIIIGSEDIDNRMNSLAVNEMVFSEYRSVDRVIEDIDKVSRDSVMAYIEEKLDPSNLSLFMLGSEHIKTSI